MTLNDAKWEVLRMGVRPILLNDDNEVVHPDSNVLPKGSSSDERDLHWYFNWAEGEIAPQPTFSIYDQELLASRCSVGSYHERVEFTGSQLRAAKRAREVDAALAMLEREQVRILQRWALPPTALPLTLRTVFGRLAGIAARTPSGRVLGDERAIDAACRWMLRKEDAPGVVTLDRRRTRLLLEAIDREADELLGQALRAFAAARHSLFMLALRVVEQRVMDAFERALAGRAAG